MSDIIILAAVFASGVWVGWSKWRFSDLGMEVKQLDREIAADMLKCAQEERRAAALRLIAQNESEANQWNQ